MTIASSASPPPPEREAAVDLSRHATHGRLDVGGVRVHFALDRALGEMTVKVVDPASGATIPHLPSEEATQLARVLGPLQGLLLQRTA